MTSVRLGLLGHPVAHSKSPALHQHFLDRAQLRGSYTLHDLPPGPGRLQRAWTVLNGLDGANLTVPLKRALLDRVEADSIAEAAGAVNAIRRDGPRWVGTNTDVGGFQNELDDVDAPSAESVLIFGAGGAARACAVAWAARGARSITLVNRSRERAERLAADLDQVDTNVLSYRDLGSLTGFDAFVNATSGSGADAVARVDTSSVPTRAIWSDLNYWMDEPPHLRSLAKRGIRTTDGRRMLVHQAALAFSWFTGKPASLSDLPDIF